MRSVAADCATYYLSSALDLVMASKTDRGEIPVVTGLIGVPFRYFVRKAITLIGIRRFEGISAINLTYESSPVRLVGATFVNHPVFGFYFPTTDAGQARIVLYLEEIYRGIPFLLRFSPIMILRFIQTLSHEVAHHQVKQRRQIFSDSKEEEVASRYSRAVLAHVRRRAWYRFWDLVLREVSNWHFAFARADYRGNDYVRARNHFYIAWDLNPRNVLAAEWYWHVTDILGKDQYQSSLPGETLE